VEEVVVVGVAADAVAQEARRCSSGSFRWHLKHRCRTHAPHGPGHRRRC
jgi:hypothetical protein